MADLPEGYEIRFGTQEDCAALPAIELAAAEQFIGRSELGNTTYDITRTAPVEFLEMRAAKGLLWVLTYKSAPVGFAFGTWEDGDFYLGEVDIHPDHGRKGLGRALVKSFIDFGFANGAERVTLSTFTEIPWNKPFYEGIGFCVVPQVKWDAFMQEDMAGQKEAGLDISKRCFMALLIPTTSS